LFLGNVAVIEKHGIPHKVEFTGGSRRVIIDGNYSITLAFGETKQVVIDSMAHTLRFGAPSRELYLGDYPINVIFGMRIRYGWCIASSYVKCITTIGGPPVVVKINYVTHSLQLLGPVPEVLMHNDPSYELAAQLTMIRSTRPHLHGEPPNAPLRLARPLLKRANQDDEGTLQFL